MRTAYGIEYDSIDPTILKRSLEHKNKQFIFAGQLMGPLAMKKLHQGLIAEYAYKI